MRSRKTVQALTIVLAVLLSTLALPASRSVVAGSGEATAVRSANQFTGPLTISRLLANRLQWMLGLSRALEPTEPEHHGTQSIVDEPDPTTARPPSEPPPDDKPEPEDRDQDEGDPGNPSQEHQQISVH